MRSLVLPAALAAISLVATAADAEAKRRGFGLFGSSKPAPSRSAMPENSMSGARPAGTTMGVIAPIPSVRSNTGTQPASAARSGGLGLIGSAVAAPFVARPAAPAPVAQAAEPKAPKEWCPSKRLIGQGKSGFCEIN